MSSEDLDYFQRRAAVQLALAERAELPQVVSAHHQLANAYLDRLHGRRQPAVAGKVS